MEGEVSAKGKLLVDRAGPIKPAVGDGAIEFGRLQDMTSRFTQDKAAVGNEPERSACRYAMKQHIALAHASKHVGPVSGFMVPIIGTTGGGIVGVGVRDPRTDEERSQVLWLPAQISKPVVFRLDAKGQLEWEKSFERAELDAYGGGLAIEAPDGDVLVMIPSYQRQTWGYVARLLKLGRAGEVRWESSLPANPATDRSPELEKMRLSDRGHRRSLAQADLQAEATRVVVPCLDFR